MTRTGGCPEPTWNRSMPRFYMLTERLDLILWTHERTARLEDQARGRMTAAGQRLYGEAMPAYEHRDGAG